MTLLITDRECEDLISIKDAIPVIEEAFRMAGEGSAENPARLRMAARRGKGLQIGPAALHAKEVMGFKVRSDFGTPLKQRWNFLYSTRSGELLAIVQATALGRIRTAAATAVAAKYLSPAIASVVGIYGAGRHAGAQIEAISHVRPIRAAHVYSRTPDRREAFCRKLAAQLGIEVIPVQTPEEVPKHADIIVTMTNSATPVLLGEWIVRPGLVIGVGANHEFEREIDEHVVEMAKLVVVDQKEAAKVEGGDLLWPIEHGILRWEQVRNLGDVVAGYMPVPDFSSGIILFESQGVSLEDVAIAAHVHGLARERGVGTQISL